MADTLDEALKQLAKKRAVPRITPTRLPLRREQLRGLPNSMARSALFTCAHPRTPRAYLNRQRIASLANYEIYYTGAELRQEDEDVFLQVVHLARYAPVGEVVEIAGNQMLTALKWNNSKRDYDRLRDCIDRLKEGTIRVTQDGGKSGYAGSLIRKFTWQQDQGTGTRMKWRIYLEREIVALFGDEAYTLLCWEDRSKLSRLAKWLHAFYHTHGEPYPIKAETLMRLSGSKFSELRDFRKEIRKALDELVAIGFLKSWSRRPDSDVFAVTRTPPALR